MIPDNLKAGVLQALVSDPIPGETYRQSALEVQLGCLRSFRYLLEQLRLAIDSMIF